MVKNMPAMQETQVQSLGQKIPWRREWQPTPVFLPGESHGQRSLVGYSPWGCKESDTTEATSHTHICIYIYIYISPNTYIQILLVLQILLISLYTPIREIKWIVSLRLRDKAEQASDLASNLPGHCPDGGWLCLPAGTARLAVL